MKTLKEEINIEQPLENLETENGIVVPAILWWLGVPITLLIILWLVGVI